MTEPAHRTPAQRLARDCFNLEKAMAGLPPNQAPTASMQGSAGVRLRPHLVADISNDELREFAKQRLGADRCSVKYLEALRVVLGNQANAERKHYRLELNIRVPFATERTMRTIIDQMKSAGITTGVTVMLGAGRPQCVQCFEPAIDTLEPEAVMKAQEVRSDSRLQSKVWDVAPPLLRPDEVPH